MLKDAKVRFYLAIKSVICNTWNLLVFLISWVEIFLKFSCMAEIEHLGKFQLSLMFFCFFVQIKRTEKNLKGPKYKSNGVCSMLIWSQDCNLILLVAPTSEKKKIFIQFFLFSWWTLNIKRKKKKETATWSLLKHFWVTESRLFLGSSWEFTTHQRK